MGSADATSPQTQPDAAEIQARAVRYATAIVGPFYSLYRRIGWALVVALAVAFGVALMAPDRLIPVGAGVAVLLVCFGIAILPLRDIRLRRARELFADHDCHERAEWRRETGTSMPHGLNAIAKWLVQNPTAKGRASLLLVMGRVAEADEVMKAHAPRTPEEVFDYELLLQTRTLLLGGRPDPTELREQLAQLPNPREMRHRRECLALLEAQAAAAIGHDPIDVMATARNEVAAVYWRYNTPTWLALLIGVFILGVVFAALLGASIAGL